MNDGMTDISKKLQEYDEAFDFYMDRGQLPDSIPHGDLLEVSSARRFKTTLNWRARTRCGLKS